MMDRIVTGITVVRKGKENMLTSDQLRHFSEKGWVAQPDVFDASQVAQFRAAFDEHIDLHPDARLQYDDEIRTLQFVMNYDPVFRECLMDPQILSENRQLTGTELKYITSWIISRNPSPGRHDRAEELLEPEKQKWHRDLRPQWGIFPDDDDAQMINSVYNNSLVLLTDVGKSDGGTLMLDGSHRMEGIWKELMSRCTVSQVTGRAGTVVYFSETLFHSGVAILSERRRDVLFAAYAPPWFKTWFRSEVPEDVLASVTDETQRNVLEGWNVFSYHGQFPVR